MQIRQSQPILSQFILIQYENLASKLLTNQAINAT